MGTAREHGLIDGLNPPACARSPTPLTKAAGQRSPCHSVVGNWTPTPASIDACRATRSRSTPLTPVTAALARVRTLSSELDRPPPEPWVSQQGNRTGQGR